MSISDVIWIIGMAKYAFRIICDTQTNKLYYNWVDIQFLEPI